MEDYLYRHNSDPLILCLVPAVTSAFPDGIKEDGKSHKGSNPWSIQPCTENNRGRQPITCKGHGSELDLDSNPSSIDSPGN